MLLHIWCPVLQTPPRVPLRHSVLPYLPEQVDIEGNIEELSIYMVPIRRASGIYAYVGVWVVAM